MNYTHYAKCTFIGKNHAIFDFTIWGDFTTIICEGNLIINKRIASNVEVCMKVPNAEVPHNEIEKAVKNCQKRAKFIF